MLAGFCRWGGWTLTVLLLLASVVLLINILILRSNRHLRITKDHEIVLASLAIVPQAIAEDIANATHKNLEVVINLLAILKSHQFVNNVHQASVYETGWVLLPKGRNYLVKNNLLPKP